MQGKKIWFSILMIPLLLVFACALYLFTYQTVNKSFFEATVTQTVETMQVMRDLGIQLVDKELNSLKTDLQRNASANWEQLTGGALEERAAALSQMKLPKDGIDYWYCTPEGDAVDSSGKRFCWDSLPGLKQVFSAGETAVLAPYFDQERNYFLPAVSPVYRNGQMAGLLVVRLDGFCISRWIGTIRFQTGEGLAYIIAGDGRNIATTRKENFDWITDEYNSQKLLDPDEESKTVANLEKLPLEGKSGAGTYQWDGSTNYLVYAPMEETDWGFFVGFYGDTMGDTIQRVASKSTASSQPLIIMLFLFLAALAAYANYNLRKERGYVKELLQQKQEIQRQAEELSVSEERFRVALERTSNIVFEYDLNTGNLTNFRTTKEVDHYETSFQDLESGLVLGGTIDTESLALLKSAFQEICNGNLKNECVIKAFLDDGEVVWYKVSITSISNQNQHPTRAIGILEDITKEKRAELDPLTGLYNKKVITEQIIASLRQRDERETSAFLMFDIDNFKAVNDTYGHPAGDQVIVQVANILKNLFSSKSYLGRIGGDEFCVFCYGSPTQQELKNTLDKVREQMKRQFEVVYNKVPITYSCGVAFTSNQNETFETLYQKADTVLYQAKNHGKNQYRFDTKID